MGFLSRLIKPSNQEIQDPQAELIKELLADARVQRQEMMQMVGKMLDQQAQQAGTMQKLLNQYIAVGENQTTTMDSRMFAKELKETEDDMWEPFGENPFKHLGLTE